MSAIDVRVLLTDNRDGCRYERDYIGTLDWSESCADFVGIVLPDCWPDYAHPRSRYGGGHAAGIIRDRDGCIVGGFEVTDLEAATL